MNLISATRNEPACWPFDIRWPCRVRGPCPPLVFQIEFGAAVSGRSFATIISTDLFKNHNNLLHNHTQTLSASSTALFFNNLDSVICCFNTCDMANVSRQLVQMHASITICSGPYAIAMSQHRQPGFTTVQFHLTEVQLFLCCRFGGKMCN